MKRFDSKSQESCFVFLRLQILKCTVSFVLNGWDSVWVLKMGHIVRLFLIFDYRISHFLYIHFIFSCTAELHLSSIFVYKAFVASSLCMSVSKAQFQYLISAFQG
ncbi:unnamed protein product [Ixodes pacificus]